MRTLTKEIRNTLTPAIALRTLLQGNQRFSQNFKANRDLLRQVGETSEGQFPLAVILSCMDSRTSAELIFDQGLGDIFSIRIAGNIVSSEVLGSIEYAVAIADVKLVMVLGHTRCGAVSGACADVRLGHLTTMLERIKPAIGRTTQVGNSDQQIHIDRVSAANVCVSIEQIIDQSEVVRDLMDKGVLGLAGAMYDVVSGGVEVMSACEHVRGAAPYAAAHGRS